MIEMPFASFDDDRSVRRSGPGGLVHGWIGRVSPARIGIQAATSARRVLPSRPGRGRCAAASLDRLAEATAVRRCDVRQHGVARQPSFEARPLLSSSRADAVFVHVQGVTR